MLLGCCVAIIIVVVVVSPFAASARKKSKNLIHFQLDYEVARPFAGLFIKMKE